jgi:ATP-dependent DNA helicase PIF1
MEKRQREDSIEDVFGDKQWSPSQMSALISVLQRGKSVFITGPGGMGKSEMIRQIRKVMNSRGQKVAVLAPTGVAALTIDGQTIYSFMHFNEELLKKSKQQIAAEFLAKRKKVVEIFQSYKALIIDEVSMLDPNDLETMDWILQQTRRDFRCFGGLQMILVGDFHQLPPVSAVGARRFVFDSPSFYRAIDDMHELKEPWRQNDPQFLDLLHRVRRGQPDSNDIELLNSRIGVELECSRRGIIPTRLYPKNEDVDAINFSELEKLDGQSQVYEAKYGKYRNRKEDDGALIKLLKNLNVIERVKTFDKFDKLSDYSFKTTELKVGAQVMLTYNLDIENGLVNGARGVILKFGQCNEDREPEKRKVFNESSFAQKSLPYIKPDVRLPIVRFTNGQEIEVPFFKTTLEFDGNEAYCWRVGVRLAWATTIHKSQSLTLDAVETDLSNCFQPGMAYVALSRVKSLDTLTLKNAVNASMFKADQQVVSFYNKPWVMHKAIHMSSID